MPSNRDHKALNRGALGVLVVDQETTRIVLASSSISGSSLPQCGSLFGNSGPDASVCVCELWKEMGTICLHLPMYLHTGHMVSIRWYLGCLRV